MQAKVSFTQKVKEELCSIPFSDEHLRAFLAAFIKVNGHLTFKEGKSSIVCKTENAKIAKFIYHSIDRIYGITPRFSYSKEMNFKKRVTYSVIIDEGDYIIGDLEISFLDGKIAKNIVLNDDMISGYVSGAFLAAGSVNSPKNSNYHLEISLNDESYAKWFSKLIVKYKGGYFEPKVVQRRNNYVVYLKKAQQVVDFLSMIGCVDKTLEFESIRIDREYSAIGNRLQILDSANYEKTTSAAKKQIKEIRIIDAALGIENVQNKKQQVLMKLRLDNEDLTMFELAQKMSEELGEEISKSNINHLFRAIHNQAERYKGVMKK
jgi:hypothetical protein